MLSPDELKDKRLPLFVYGTLRQGQQNFALLRGHILVDQPAKIRGMSLYSLRAYPVVVHGEHTVSGELLTINPRVYDRLLTDLDQLEGCSPGGTDSMFRRVVVQVETDTRRRIAAWMYLSQRKYLSRYHLLIAHGDWVRHRQELIQSTRFGRFILEENKRMKGSW